MKRIGSFVLNGTNIKCGDLYLGKYKEIACVLGGCNSSFLSVYDVKVLSSLLNEEGYEPRILKRYQPLIEKLKRHE